MKISKAVILAAGFGSRLKHLTENIPKALLPIGGTTLIERTIQLLIEQDFDEIFIVSGYAHDILENYLNNSVLKNKIKLTIIYNDNYKTMNNFYSFYLIKNYISEPFIMFNADIVFDKRILGYFLEKINNHSNLFVIDDVKTLGIEEMKVVVDDTNSIIDIGKHLSPEISHGEFIGISYFITDTLQTLFDSCQHLIDEKQVNVYYEDVIAKVIKTSAFPLKAVSTRKLLWTEIDTQADLDIAVSLVDNYLDRIEK